MSLLIVREVYRMVVDAEAQAHYLLPVVDEDKSGPGGYLYSASMFASIELPGWVSLPSRPRRE